MIINRYRIYLNVSNSISENKMINKDFSLLPIDYPSNLILDRHTLKINSNHTKLRHLQNNNRCKGMLENLVHNMRMSYLRDKRQKAQ